MKWKKIAFSQRLMEQCLFFCQYISDIFKCGAHKYMFMFMMKKLVIINIDFYVCQFESYSSNKMWAWSLLSLSQFIIASLCSFYNVSILSPWYQLWLWLDCKMSSIHILLYSLVKFYFFFTFSSFLCCFWWRIFK